MSKDTPRTQAVANEICKSGVDWHHSATLMKRHAEELERERENLRQQRDQVLHLLAGGTLTVEQVTESGLGVGVLSEQRHHEHMRCKAEAERDQVKANYDALLKSDNERIEQIVILRRRVAEYQPYADAALVSDAAFNKSGL